MAGRLYGPEAQAKILQNKNVLKVSESTITYSTDFKVQAVREYLSASKPPQAIFLDAGFDLELIGRETPKRCLLRWKTMYKQRGEEGLRNDRRGKGATGRPPEGELTVEEKLHRAEARIHYLEEENELLKKLNEIEGRWLTDPRKSTR